MLTPKAILEYLRDNGTTESRVLAKHFNADEFSLTLALLSLHRAGHTDSQIILEPELHVLITISPTGLETL